ncbi:hypothetical protein NE237_016190 [Protea cynaroides]|uniref:Alpha/beta hydrolase fold-3 domain-containing protein n=1 Tax=Protea cynaroides TaxID=273540 RepID=A0A9Q0KFS1_9MAGN|nr:hypothetical protein NE237_016190 [Protea cynaroides]
MRQRLSDSKGGIPDDAELGLSVRGPVGRSSWVAANPILQGTDTDIDAETKFIVLNAAKLNIDHSSICFKSRNSSKVAGEEEEATDITEDLRKMKNRSEKSFTIAAQDNGTINHPVINFLEAKATVNDKPVKTSDIIVDETRNLWFCLFTPMEIQKCPVIPLPVIAFFHGGGFSFLTADALGYDKVYREFAVNFSTIIVSINYHLAPEHHFPSQYDDGIDILKFLDETEFNKFGFPTFADLSRCFLVGDSARGAVYSFGSNNTGQLGHGTLEQVEKKIVAEQ